MNDKEYREYVAKRFNNIKTANDVEFFREIIGGNNDRFNKILSNFSQSLFTKETRNKAVEPNPIDSMIEQIADYVTRGLKLFAEDNKPDKIHIYNASEEETGDGPVADLFFRDKVYRLSYLRLREIVEAQEDESEDAIACYSAAEGIWRDFCNHCEDTNSALEEVCTKVSKAFGGVPCYLNGSAYTGSEI